MSTSAADLASLKTQAQKAFQAYQNDLGIGIGEVEAARRQAAPPKPRGKKPLYHGYFGSYFFWVVTGKGISEMGGTAEEYFGPTKSQDYLGSITRWIMELLNQDKEELAFNQYAYLQELLLARVPQYGEDAPHFQPLVAWLQERVDKADAYAKLFSPMRYNVRTLVDAKERDLNGELILARPLTPDEQKRLDYYQRINARRDELAEEKSILCERLQKSSWQPTQEDIQPLAQLERQLEFLALDQLDQLDLNRLHARATRKQNAEEFKKGLETRLLQLSHSGLDLELEFPSSFKLSPDNETGIYPPRIRYTLAELIREFDANLAMWSTPSSRADYATQQLRLFDANRPDIIRQFDPYLEKDELKITALNDVLNRVRTAYEQHQKHILQAFAPSVDRPGIARFNPKRLPKPFDAPSLIAETETEVKPMLQEEVSQVRPERTQDLPYAPATPVVQTISDTAVIQASLTDVEQPTGQANKNKVSSGFSPFEEALNFTEEMADQVAIEIELIDELGNYCADNGNGGKKAGRLCGFYWQLKTSKKVTGNLEQLRDYFFSRYLGEVSKTSPDTSSKVARETSKATEKALNRLFPPGNQE